jgi:hypothetical protein
MCTLTIVRFVLDVIPTGRATATVLFGQEQIDQLRGAPGRARVPVRITHAGRDFRTSISVYRGEWMMVVNAQMRAAGMIPGTSCEVDIVVDDGERTVEVPADLDALLLQHGLHERWSALSYTKRKEVVTGIESAKRPETRARRVAEAVAALLDTPRARSATEG